MSSPGEVGPHDCEACRAARDGSPTPREAELLKQLDMMRDAFARLRDRKEPTEADQLWVLTYIDGAGNRIYARRSWERGDDRNGAAANTTTTIRQARQFDSAEDAAEHLKKRGDALPPLFKPAPLTLGLFPQVLR